MRTSPRGSSLLPEHVIHLRSARLVMRRFTPEDDLLIVDLDSDPEVVRWVGQLEPTTPQLVRERVMPALLAWYATDPPQTLVAT